MRSKNVLVALLVSLVSSSAFANDWSIFKSDEFGFAMLVPPGLELAGKNLGKGWAGLAGKKGDLAFLAVAKLGTFASAKKILAAASKLTKVPAKSWAKVDEASEHQGWKFLRAYHADRADGRGILSIVGNGPKGSYLMLLATTATDFEGNKQAYLAWIKSLTVF